MENKLAHHFVAGVILDQLPENNIILCLAENH